MMRLRILGLILTISAFAFYYFDVLEFQGSDVLLGLISALGLGFLLGAFKKK